MTSDDKFDLDELKSAMNVATPPIDPATRAAHLRLAEENFDRMFEGKRPAEQGRFAKWLGALLTPGGTTAVTACFAVGFVALTPLGQSLLQPPSSIPEPAAESAPGAVTTDSLLTELNDATPETELTVEELLAPSTADDEAAPDAEGGFAQEIVESPVIIVTPTQSQLPNSSGTTDTSRRAELGSGTETFANAPSGDLQVVAEAPVSTFSIDVDTASYGFIRQSLTNGSLPPRDAVRVEEMINYFPYDYSAPAPGASAPFQPNITLMDTPWNEDTRLVHIGLQGVLPVIEDRPPLNLVFLIDTSGSMDQPNKLPLLRQSFLLMLDQLRPEDEVASVTYAGSAGLALVPTPASDRAAISAALNALSAGGSTNGQGGLAQAYAVAAQMQSGDDVSRVILATDGDFNVGIIEDSDLERYIASQRDGGTYLSVLGFGRGNLDDATMQTLAQNGNGTAAYIDTLNEAQKVLVDQLTGALFAIANDVKVQIEFNPAVIAEYRLIGYETRALDREDFNNDNVDAGELGAGHAVTAIYEVTPVGSNAVLNDDLRYGAQATSNGSAEIGFLRLRWKAPGDDESQLLELPILDIASGGTPGTEVRFATAIAGFGQLLRDDSYLGSWGWDDAIALANGARGEDPFGYRTEAVRLMRLAQSLSVD